MLGLKDAMTFKGLKNGEGYQASHKSQDSGKIVTVFVSVNFL